MSDIKQTPKRKKWPLIAGGALVVLAIVAVPGVMRNRTANGAAVDAATQANAIVTAFTGDLSSTATASGQIEALRDAQLSLGVSGTVENVLVRVGDEVNAGDVLVQLDAAALARSVANAEQNLIIQEANLAELLNGASASDLASAQAAVDSAQANLDKVKAGAEPEDIAAARASLTAAQAAYAEVSKGPDTAALAQAEASLRSAEATLRKAQMDYDAISWRSDIGRTQEAVALEQATSSYEAAKASYDSAAEGPKSDQIEQARANVVQAQGNLQQLLDGSSAAELASAESQLASAQAQLASLVDSASAEKVAISQAQVEQARISLEDARDNLAKASLTAPFDGVVTAVYVAEGETASGPAIDLVDANHLEVILSVDEVDIGQLAVGQPAIITLETWPDTEIAGEIVSIAPKSTANNSAIVSYEVRLSLGETSLPVLVGMTANADLVTAAKKNVLLVPNDVITADRENNTYFVNRVTTTSDGSVSTEPVAVTIGLKDGDFTEITSGLQEGDRLSTIIISAGVEEASNGFAPPQPPGGGNGGGPFGR